MRTIERMRQALDPFRASVTTMARRMVVTLSSRALWQLAGYRAPDVSEVLSGVEVFAGIGFHSRPPSSGKPEAIVIMLGADATTPVVVAVRDEATRAAVAALLENESMVFNTLACMHVTQSGKVEARSVEGVAVPLATLADMQALRTWLLAHTHTSGGSGTPSTPPPVPTGTAVLRGE